MMCGGFALRPSLARACVHVTFVLALVASTSVRGQAGAQMCLVDEPSGYRTHDYLAPTTCTLAGARVLSTQELVRLRAESQLVLIDVLPSPRRPAALAPDAIWLPKPRANIPGSVWLPNVGFGVLPVEEERYFSSSLERLSAGNRDCPLVFYCLLDCWMSWNAAKRALEWGYTTVYWYPAGTDGWSMAGRALAPSQPVPAQP